MTDQIRLQIKTENGTAQLAEAFSQLVEQGDIILLSGDLGAGKSFFARQLLRILANDNDMDVPSPTFSLVQPYQLQKMNCLHADLYRLSDESEAEELGLFDGNNLLLIEWPDRLPELAANARFALEIKNVPNAAEERLVAVDAKKEDLKALAAGLESSSDIALLS